MREPERIDRILEKIRTAWKDYPDLRLGQLLYIANRMMGKEYVDVFNVEDDEMEKALNRLNREFNQLRKKTNG